MLCATGKHLIVTRAWSHRGENYCSAHVPGEAVIADSRDAARVQAMAAQLAEEEAAEARLDEIMRAFVAKVARDLERDAARPMLDTDPLVFVAESVPEYVEEPDTTPLPRESNKQVAGAWVAGVIR